MTTLRGLTAVDWSSVQHAYGPALDTPVWLEALAGGDAKARKKALARLEETIHHQTETYSASAAAVPFLVEIARDTAYPDRVAVVEFLSALAVGEPDPVRGFDVRTGEGRGALDARDGGFVTYEAVASQLPTLAGLLSDDVPAIRTAVAFLLSEFVDHAADLLRVVRAAITKETNVDARTSLLLCLRFLARATADHDDLPSLEARVAAGTPDEPDAVAAAIARLDIGGGHDPSIDFLTRAQSVKTNRTWSKQLRLIARWVIDGLDLDLPPERLIEELENASTSPGRKRFIALRLLPQLLPLHKGSHLLPEELSIQAHRVLVVIARDQLFPTNELDVFFHRRGIPLCREHARWLGLVPPGLLERRVKHDGREWPLWKWLHAAVKVEIAETLAAAAAESGLTPEERIELVFPRDGDLLVYQYSLQCRFDAEGPDDNFGIKRREERADGLAASILVTAGLDAVVTLGKQIVAGERTGLARSVVVAIGRLVHARHEPFPEDVLPLWDKWVGLCRLHREAFASLSMERRESLIWAQGFEEEKIIEPSPEGPVENVFLLDGWTVADLCPTPNVIDLVVDTIHGWKGSPRALRQFVDIAVRLGAVVRPRVTKTLAKKKNPNRAALLEVIERLDRTS